MRRAIDLSNRPMEAGLTDQGKIPRLVFVDGSSFALAAEDFRSNNPSVEGTRSASRADRNFPGVKDVAILAVELVGNYAMGMPFDDRRESGIYSWDPPRRLGAAGEKIELVFLRRAQRRRFGLWQKTE